MTVPAVEDGVTGAGGATASASARTVSVSAPIAGGAVGAAVGQACSSYTRPTCRTGPSAGSSTSMTQPSATSASSWSASSGDRIGCNGTPTSAPSAIHGSAGNLAIAAAMSGW